MRRRIWLVKVKPLKKAYPHNKVPRKVDSYNITFDQNAKLVPEEDLEIIVDYFYIGKETKGVESY